MNFPPALGGALSVSYVIFPQYLLLDFVLDDGGFSCLEAAAVVGGFIASGLAMDEALEAPLRVLDLGSLPNEDTIGEQSGGVEEDGMDSRVGCEEK